MSEYCMGAPNNQSQICKGVFMSYIYKLYPAQYLSIVTFQLNIPFQEHAVNRSDA